MEAKTLLDTDVLSGVMRKNPTALSRVRSYLADFGRIAGLRIDNWLTPK
jgi:hypothetical protein